MEQVSGPGDGTRHYRQVPHDGRVSALLLVLILNFGNQARVLVEENCILTHQAVLQIIAMKDGAELAE